MAVPYQLKRSAVSGKIPLVTDLQVGQLALNTADGKLFVRKGTGADDVIVEIGAGGGGGGVSLSANNTWTGTNTWTVGQTFNSTINGLILRAPGTLNYAIGNANTMAAAVTGSYNFAAGSGALGSLTSGSYNVGIGHAALNVNTEGSNNMAMGMNALTANTTGESNVAIGRNALKNSVTASYSVGIGYDALGFATGGNNIGIGYLAGLDVTSGANNTFIGYNTGRGITTGFSNTIIGALVQGLPANTINNVIISDGNGTIRYRYNDGTGLNYFYQPLVLPASGTAAASLSIPAGTAPTTPGNGDVWVTADGLYTRINGVTKKLNDQVTPPDYWTAIYNATITKTGSTIGKTSGGYGYGGLVYSDTAMTNPIIAFTLPATLGDIFVGVSKAPGGSRVDYAILFAADGQLSYWVDGTYTSAIGPYNAGQACTVRHIEGFGLYVYYNDNVNVAGPFSGVPAGPWYPDLDFLSQVSVTNFSVSADGIVASSGDGKKPKWGEITGTLSTQTDLQTALNAKANLAGGAAFTGKVTSSGQTIIGGTEPITGTSANLQAYYGLFVDTTGGYTLGGGDYGGSVNFIGGSASPFGFPEVHIRGNAGYGGALTFSENTIADRWTIGIKTADSGLYFGIGRSYSTIAMHIGSNAKVTFYPAYAGSASINLPHATATPTTLSNGDIWTETTGVYARVNGATKQLDTAAGGLTVTPITANTNVTATSGEVVILANATGLTVNLPTAVGNTAKITIKLTVAGTCTVDANASETIDGGLTAVLSRQYESITLVSDNVNWMII